MIDIFTDIYTFGIIVREYLQRYVLYALADIPMTDIYTIEIFTAVSLNLHKQALRTT